MIEEAVVLEVNGVISLKYAERFGTLLSKLKRSPLAAFKLIVKPDFLGLSQDGFIIFPYLSMALLKIFRSSDPYFGDNLGSHLNSHNDLIASYAF